MAKNKKNEVISTALLDETKASAGNPSKAKSSNKPVGRSFATLSPICSVTNNDFYVMANGELLEIVQIDSKDTYSLNDTDLMHDISVNASLYTAEKDSLKILPLNMQMDLHIQKKYFTKKLNYNKVPAYTRFLEARLQEFENIEKLRTNREYFLFIYEKDEFKLLKRVQEIKARLSRSNPVYSLSLEKKNSILFQLSNPMTKNINY